VSAKKKATNKKAPAKKTAAKKAPAKKASAKKVTKKVSAKPAATKKAATKKAAAKKAPAKKAAAKKAAPAKTPPPAERTIPAKYKYLHDKNWQKKQREALITERANYTSSAERLAAEAAALMADREPGDVQFDEESGEGDTIAVERDRDLALSAAARQSVSDIDAALERLDNNTYGMCIAGDDIIPRERLEAIPEAAVCVTHKTSMF
jgi:RNA polymerase-binding transcription factor DksA